MTILNVFKKKKGLKYAQKTDFIVSEIFFFRNVLIGFVWNFHSFILSFYRVGGLYS